MSAGVETRKQSCPCPRWTVAANTARQRAMNESTPLGRLHNDGACSKEAIRRRILCLAAEQKLPEQAIKAVMTCHT